MIAMLVKFDKELNNYKPWDAKPVSKQDMLTNKNWTTGGQHTHRVMREMMSNPFLGNQVVIKAYYGSHNIIVMWSLDKEKVRYMSKVYLMTNMLSLPLLRISHKDKQLGLTTKYCIQANWMVYIKQKRM